MQPIKNIKVNYKLLLRYTLFKGRHPSSLELLLDHLWHIDVHSKDLIHEHLDDSPLILLAVLLDLLDLLADLILLRDHLLVQPASLSLLPREPLRCLLLTAVQLHTRIHGCLLDLLIPIKC